MKTNLKSSLIILAALPFPINAATSNNTVSYIIGGVIAIFILGYLIYTLIKPERF